MEDAVISATCVAVNCRVQECLEVLAALLARKDVDFVSTKICPQSS